MKTCWSPAAIVAIVVLGLMHAVVPVYAADEARLGIELPCTPKRDLRIVHQKNQTMTVSGESQSTQEKGDQSQRSTRTEAIDYHVSRGHVDLRMSVDGTMLPGNIRLSKSLEFQRIVP